MILQVTVLLRLQYLHRPLLRKDLKNVAAGANPMDLKRGIDKAVEAIVENLAKQSKKVGDSSEKIKQVLLFHPITMKLLVNYCTGFRKSW